MIDVALRPGKGQSLAQIAIITVSATLALGLLSGWVSNSGFGNEWFDALAKPAAMPPGWTFGVAWTTLYILLGTALAFILATPDGTVRTAAVGIFLAQMLLNYAWSPLFFWAHQIVPALALIIVIFVLAAATSYLFMRIRPMTGLLMLPYLAWLTFATYLNYQIMALNPGA